jgi:carbon storage regulator CsrA
MLVLSRRADEEIVIDGHIRIRVLSSSGGKVRLGITAPRDVPIERGELAGTRTIECLTPPRRDGLLFELRGTCVPSRCAEPRTVIADEREFPSLPI